MKISQVSDTLTLIELSAQEVKKYCICFEESDYNTPAARLAFWEMLSDAERISGKSLQISSALEIDFMPDIKGGCLIIISEETEKADCAHICENEKLYISDGIDEIIDFAKAVKSCKADISCSLYKGEKDYRLLISPFNGKVDLLAAEYRFEGTVSTAAIESTKEAYPCLIKDRALEILGGFFSEL